LCRRPSSHHLQKPRVHRLGLEPTVANVRDGQRNVDVLIKVMLRILRRLVIPAQHVFVAEIGFAFF
jgi:hypothetical protein